MVSFYGDYNLTETVNIPFNTFSSDDPSASVTVTDLANGDIYVHKDGVEGTPTGITISLNVGSVNGNHLAILDLSDTNDADFYAVGARYQVRMEGVTIDGATVNAWIGAFSIGCTLRPTTAGRTLDIQATGEVDANLTMMGGGAQSATDLKDFADAGYDPNTNKVQGVVLTDTCTTNTDLVTAAAVKTAIEAGGSSLAQILADTNELQGDDIPATLSTIAGYLDTEIAAIVAAVITNAAGADIAADIIAMKAETVLIVADTNELQTDDIPGTLSTIGTATARLTAVRAAVLTDLIDGGRLDLLIDAIKVITDALTAAAATKMALAASTMVTGIVSWDNTNASTTVFYADDIAEATADHYNGRIVLFTSGALIGQASDITDYALVSSEGKFTVTALTEAPADNVTFIII